MLKILRLPIILFFLFLIILPSKEAHATIGFFPTQGSAPIQDGSQQIYFEVNVWNPSAPADKDGAVIPERFNIEVKAYNTNGTLLSNYFRDKSTNFYFLLKSPAPSSRDCNRGLSRNYNSYATDSDAGVLRISQTGNSLRVNNSQLLTDSPTLLTSCDSSRVPNKQGDWNLRMWAGDPDPRSANVQFLIGNRDGGGYNFYVASSVEKPSLDQQGQIAICSDIETRIQVKNTQQGQKYYFWWEDPYDKYRDQIVETLTSTANGSDYIVRPNGPVQKTGTPGFESTTNQAKLCMKTGTPPDKGWLFGQTYDEFKLCSRSDGSILTATYAVKQPGQCGAPPGTTVCTLAISGKRATLSADGLPTQKELIFHLKNEDTNAIIKSDTVPASSSRTATHSFSPELSAGTYTSHVQDGSNNICVSDPVTVGASGATCSAKVQNGKLVLTGSGFPTSGDFRADIAINKTTNQPILNIRNNGGRIDHQVNLAQEKIPAGTHSIFFYPKTGTATLLCSIPNITIDGKDTQPPLTAPKQCSDSPGADVPQCSRAAGEACTYSSGKTGIMSALGCIPTDPGDLINAILRVSTFAAGGIALLLMIFGSIQMIASSGNPETLKKGQDQFTAAIIGLLFIIFATLVLQFVGVNILSIPGFK